MSNEVKPLSAEEVARVWRWREEALTLWSQGCADGIDDLVRYSLPRVLATIEAQQKQIAGATRIEELNRAAQLAENDLSEEFGHYGCDTLDHVCDALVAARHKIAAREQVRLTSASRSGDTEP